MVGSKSGVEGRKVEGGREVFLLLGNVERMQRRIDQSKC